MKTTLFLFVFLITNIVFTNNTTAQSMPWTVIEDSDEFGDETGSYSLVSQTINATFSNNTISNQPLSVFIVFSKEWGIIFQLKEYGKYFASLDTGYNQDMKVKTASGKTFKFSMIPRSKGRLIPYYSQTYQGNTEDFYTFIQLLKDENSLKCVFMDSSYQLYKFDINCIGFTKAYNTFLTKNKIEKIKLLDKETAYKIGK